MSRGAASEMVSAVVWYPEHFAPARELRRIVEHVTGPLREANDIEAATTKGQWRLHGRHRGRPTQLVLHHRYSGGRGGVGYLEGISFSVPLGGRPIQLSMHFPRIAPGAAPAPIPGNEGAMFPHGTVTGIPIEVLRDALDPATRAAVNGALGPAGLQMSTEGDSVGLYMDLRPTPNDRAVMPAPALLAERLDLLCAFADRLVRAFDERHAEALRTGGPAAAAQWLASVHHAHSEAAAKVRSRALVSIIGSLVVLFVVFAIIMTIRLVAC